MNKSEFTLSKFILFVNILVVITFILAYVIYNSTSDKQEEEAKIVAIEGIITNIDNNRLSIDVESISTKYEYEISKAIVLIEDSTEIVSQSDEIEPKGGFLSPRAPAPISELIDKSSISIKDKVRIFTNSSNTTLILETNTLETKANIVQVLSKIVR